jgi:hypothetical protein
VANAERTENDCVARAHTARSDRFKVRVATCQNSRACRVLVRVFRAGDDVNKDDVCLFCNPLFVAHFVPNLQGWGAAPGPSE